MLDKLIKIRGVLGLEYDKEYDEVRLTFDIRKRVDVVKAIQELGITKFELSVNVLNPDWDDPDSDSIEHNLISQYVFHMPW